MKTNTTNGYNFAEFIIKNNLYDASFFMEDYEEYLHYDNKRNSFWDDFEYSMRVDFNSPVKQ